MTAKEADMVGFGHLDTPRPSDAGIRGASVNMTMTDKFDCDEATISIGLSGEGDTLQEVRDMYDETRGRILRELLAIGMPEDAFAEEPFSTSPRTRQVYEEYVPKPTDVIERDAMPWGRASEDSDLVGELRKAIQAGAKPEKQYRYVANVIDGYMFQASIRVTLLMDLGIHEKAYALLLDLNDELDAHISCGIRYGLHDDNVARRSLMDVAVGKARDEAAALAMAAGDSIGKCQEIRYAAIESGYGEGNQRYQENIADSIASLRMSLQEDAFNPIPKATVAGLVVNPDGTVMRDVPDFAPSPVQIECNVGTMWAFE